MGESGVSSDFSCWRVPQRTWLDATIVRAHRTALAHAPAAIGRSRGGLTTNCARRRPGNPVEDAHTGQLRSARRCPALTTPPTHPHPPPSPPPPPPPLPLPPPPPPPPPLPPPEKDRIFSGSFCSWRMDARTLALKSALSVIVMRPTVSALRCFQTSSSGLRSGE